MTVCVCGGTTRVTQKSKICDEKMDNTGDKVTKSSLVRYSVSQSRYYDVPGVDSYSHSYQLPCLGDMKIAMMKVTTRRN